ncbi:UDP-N-acetylglucosamine 2-epimerase [bacterium]|nr:UDP-N-acetylglucosamine 2-epimerase [bacterium]
MNKRKICFVITSEIHYARNRLVLKELKKRPDIELQIVVGAGALLDFYGDVLPLLERDGFPCHAKIVMTLAGGSPIAMAKTAGVGIMEFATAFDNLRPDIVMLRADRYEMLAAAIAASYMNITVAHIEGGDVSGTIDEHVRHAITKLAHIHFATNEPAKERIIRMGENPDYVWNFGSPEIEMLSRGELRFDRKRINEIGVGKNIDLNGPYLIVMHHPVTTEVGRNRKHVEEALHAVHELGIPAVWFWPNPDAGTDETSEGIRAFRERENPKNIRFIKYLSPDDFLGLLHGAACLVGNSSAGIKECSFLGIPVVNIGTRQEGRMRGKNVIDVPYEKEAIKKAILKQRSISGGRYAPDHAYYQKGTSANIAEKLATVPLYMQKKFHD